MKNLSLFLLASRADSTVNKYLNGYERWKLWASKSGINVSLPVKPFVFALYLMSLCQSANTDSPLLTAFYSIRGGLG